MSILSIDFETCSELDLRRTGVHVYASHPSTRIICMAWAFDDETPTVWTPGTPFPNRIWLHVLQSGLVSGWNVKFEHAIWNHILHIRDKGAPYLTVPQLRDTMATAAYFGLPLSLDMAAEALKLPVQKDKAGHALMLRMCRPRTKHPVTWWHETDKGKLFDLMTYCAQDVVVERAIAKALPELPERERLIWMVDAGINTRGVRVDTVLRDHLLAVTAEAKQNLDHQMKSITAGRVSTCNQTAKIMDMLHNTYGFMIPDLRKDTIKEWFPRAVGTPSEMLRLRREASRASTSKLRVLQTAVGRDERLRGMLQHYGAPRTGRWAGRLFQPQNLPRGSIKNVDQMVDVILKGADANELDLLSTDSAMGVVSSCLRSCLVPKPGNVLVSADLSQIEARVIAWLAGQQDILDVFASGQDIYKYAASKLGSNDRNYGKVLTLALGFGMGPEKFVSTAKTYGLFLTPAEAEASVSGWRDVNNKIVGFWYDLDRAVRQVIQDGRTRTVGRITIRPGVYHGPLGLILTLPSSRHLIYRNPRIEDDTIVFDGVNQYTRAWGPCRTYGGKLAENVTQAVARDIMADGLLEMANGGIEVVLSVHDEAIAEAPEAEGQATLDLMLGNLTESSPWAKGLPIAAAGWFGPRYRKG